MDKKKQGPECGFLNFSSFFSPLFIASAPFSPVFYFYATQLMFLTGSDG